MAYPDMVSAPADANAIKGKPVAETTWTDDKQALIYDAGEMRLGVPNIDGGTADTPISRITLKTGDVTSPEFGEPSFEPQLDVLQIGKEYGFTSESYQMIPFPDATASRQLIYVKSTGDFTNIILNPGFELDDPSGEYWTIDDVDNTNASAVVTATYHSGSKCMHLDLAATSESAYTQIIQSITGMYNGSELTFYVKRGASTNGTLKVIAHMQALGPGIMIDLASYDVSSISTDWEQKTVAVDYAPYDAVYVQLTTGSGTSSEVWVDDFSLPQLYPKYGFAAAENYYDGIYSRFRGVTSTTPSDPIAGDIWIDTTSGSVPKIYDGTSWISLT